MAKSLKKIALVVSLGTGLSKLAGMARQLVIASTFGVGAAYDAYTYAYILPGFLLVLLGGINGPFHSSMVSVLSRRPKEESSYIVAAINTLIGTLLLCITLLLIVSSDYIISILGPNLTGEIHKIAVLQLKLMAPIAFIAGLIGIGFGSLNATEEFWIPSISPLISSLSIIFGIGLFTIHKAPILESDDFILRGGIVLALSTLIGAFLQWSIQVPALIKKKLIKLKLVWDIKHPGVQEVWKILTPATLATGMLQINVCTDLFFASGILGAAAGLSYASLLVQAPLGLISNALLIPLLPTFARLSSEGKRFELIKKIGQSLMLSTLSMVALATIFIALGEQIIILIYKRGVFDSNAVVLVRSILIAYGFGMPVYLGRDLLVRIFYAIGNGQTPFKISVIGILLNIFFDWILVGGPSPWGNQLPFNFGAPGLVFATAIINLITCIILLIKLQFELKILPFKEWTFDTIKILIAGLFSGLSLWICKSFIIWPQNTIGIISELIFSGSFGLLTFLFVCNLTGIQEVKVLIAVFKGKLHSVLKRT